MAVKLIDVAKRAGVSITTVSLILNDKPINVSENTKKAVIQAAKEIGYIRRQKVRNIGLMLPDLGNLYYVQLMRSISLIAQKEGYNLVIFDSNNSSERELINLQSIRQSELSGLIMGITASDENIVKLRPILQKIIDTEQLTTVLLDRNGHFLNCHSICINNYYGGYLAAKHLIQLGHKKIGCITGNIKLNECQERLNGFKSVFAENELEFCETWVRYADFTLDDGYQNTQALLDQGVTAIFAQNDMIALGILHYLNEHHILVPNDISVVGFDNIPFISMVDLPLTTIAQPMQLMGEKAVEILLSHPITGNNADRITITLQPELVIRNSTAPFHS